MRCQEVGQPVCTRRHSSRRLLQRDVARLCRPGFPQGLLRQPLPGQHRGRGLRRRVGGLARRCGRRHTHLGGAVLLVARGQFQARRGPLRARGAAQHEHHVGRRRAAASARPLAPQGRRQRDCQQRRHFGRRHRPGDDSAQGLRRGGRQQRRRRPRRPRRRRSAELRLSAQPPDTPLQGAEGLAPAQGAHRSDELARLELFSIPPNRAVSS
mmetsp:Transcript_84639/g.273552  ORF Transcript_84639/g.273552 Transcript_84639/m.273552 type:complete len:211 (-) Transcript_84639:1457-2089(-)